MTSRRQSRVSELLQRELAQMISYELRDPRLATVTVTRVEVTPDLRLARVYISTLGAEGSGQDAVDSLEHAGGYLRRQLGQRTELRYLPELRFIHDTSIEQGQRMNILLDEIMATTSTESAEEDSSTTADSALTDSQ
jgi:ribosome-binding factor A